MNNRKQRRTTIISTSLLFLLLLMSSASAAINQINYSSLTSTGAAGETPRFAVQVLKYDPYPVNPGDWFDVWIKAQNIGGEDAPNARFELVLGYPFSTDEPTVQEFGIVSGMGKAMNNRKAGESQPQENQVVVKYRLKVADNAPEGTSTLRLKIGTNGIIDTQSNVDLPISIGKTKTDFDIVMQDSSEQGTAFAIANTGEFSATAVTVTIKDQDGITIKGAQSSIIGNLDKGDFTTVTFQIIPGKSTKTVTVEVAYTDIAGIRNILQKTVAVDITPPAIATTTNGATRTGSGARSSTSSRSIASLSATYKVPALAFLAGIVLMFFINRRRRKHHETA